jgi:V-type H+-transporting ATPase subunit a
MGELWRSEEMQLVQLFVQIEAAHATVDELGKLGIIQFRDVRIAHSITDILTL